MKIMYLSNKNKYMIIFAIAIFTIFLIGIINVKNDKLEAILTNASLEKKIEENNDRNKKITYLTFDDGPSKKETEKILDILKEEKIKGTFFVIGKHVKEYPEIVKREYEEGHYIANHGYSHDNSKLYQNKESFMNEIKNTDIEIAKAIGIQNYCSHIFRFPNGYMTNLYKNEKKEAVKLLEEMDYYYIDWNCLNKDSEIKASHAQLINNLKKTSNNQTPLIVLMHDTGDVNKTSEVLKESIEYLKQQGYEFKDMSDLIKI